MPSQLENKKSKITNYTVFLSLISKMIVTNHSVFYHKERISEKWKLISLKVKVNRVW